MSARLETDWYTGRLMATAFVPILRYHYDISSQL